MLIDDIKARLKTALKAGNVIEKEILRVALGEIQTEEARGAKTGDDALAAAVVRKIVKSNRETLGVSTDAEQQGTLRREIEILESLLPKNWDEARILESLAPVAEAVRTAQNDGQATGVAMKHLKSLGAPVSGKDVAQAIRRMRS